MRTSSSSWKILPATLGLARRCLTKRKRPDRTRRSRFEPLEERRLLAVSPVLRGTDAPEEPVRVAPGEFGVGDFTLITDDWSNRNDGGSVKQDDSSLGIDSGLEGNDPTAFDPDEAWTFRFDTAGWLMGIEFDEFTVDDADRARLTVGSQTFYIDADHLSNGYWRPPVSSPLEIDPGQVIRLEALQPTVHDLIQADAARNDPARQEPVPDGPPKSIWRVKGLNVVGRDDTVFGGYIDLTHRTRNERNADIDQGTVSYVDFDGIVTEGLATVSLPGVNVEIQDFTVTPGDVNSLRVQYEIFDDDASDPFDINIHRSSDGSSADGPVVLSYTVNIAQNEGTEGVHIVDIPIVDFVDIGEDYYLLAEADVDDTDDNDDREVFSGGVFVDDTGIVHFQAAYGSDDDEIEVRYASGDYEIWWNWFDASPDLDKVYFTSNLEDFARVHARTHGGTDSIDFTDSSLEIDLWAFGGAGSDNIEAGAGNDLLDGGLEYDTIYGNDGLDLIFGGDDGYSGTGYGDYLYGGSDADEIWGGEGPDYINGGNGNDLVYGGDELNVSGGFYYGGYGDILYGGAGDDVVDGGAGNDVLWGDNGDDLLIGGSGDDSIRGGLGADTLYGDAGEDTLYGYLNGGGYLGGDGADSLFAEGDGEDDNVWVEYLSDIYEADLTDNVNGSIASTPTVDEFETIIKDENAGFGLGWDLVDMDRLVFDAGPTVRWVRSDGSFVNFDDFDESASDDNDETASIISDETSYYVRRDKFGNEFYYSQDSDNEGALVKSLNRLGVGYEYAYGDHDGDTLEWEIETITIVRPGQTDETFTYEYNSGTRIEEIIDPFGRTIDLVYDGNDRLEQILLPAPNSSQPGVRPQFLFEYDSLGFLSSVTDADGRETLFDMDHVAQSGTGELVITYDDGSEVSQLPALGDAYNVWRSQLGNWAMFVPEFKFKFSLDSSARTGRQVDQLERTTFFDIDEDGFLVEMTDPAGQVTEYTRNAAGLPTRVSVTSADGTTVVSDTTYTYDPDTYNLEEVEYIDATTETWEYDPDFSQVTRYVDQLGRETLYEIDDATGNVEEMRVVVGEDDRTSSEDDDIVTLYEYEDDGLLKNVIEFRNDVDGTPLLSFVRQYTYTDVDDSGPHIGRWLDTITYGGDNPSVGGLSIVNSSTIEITSRNDFGMPETVDDELDRETAFEHDDLDRLTQVTLPDPGYSQDQPVVRYVYMLSGLLEETTRTWVGGSSPITTHIDYDDVGRVEHVFADYGGSDEAETVFDYDLTGNIVEIIDPLTHSTTFNYDVLDRPIRIIEEDPDGGAPLVAPVSFLAYDTLGRLTADRDPVGNVTRREYDQLGRMTRGLQPLGATTSYQYDNAGQLKELTDPQGRVFTYDYDDAGRLIEMLEPGLSNPTEYAYDTASNLRFVTDPLDHTSEYTYDERGRMTEALDANEEEPTVYTYTDANELESLTDPVDNTTTWVYDDAGRVRSEENELTDKRFYLYDGYGRLHQYTDRNGRVTTYEYTNLGQLEAEKWWSGVSLIRTISYDFDLVGNILSVSDPVATYEYEYDNLNRLTGIEQTIDGLAPQIVFENEYDVAGRMVTSSAEVGGTADYANSYVYDALSRLVSVAQTDDGGNSVSDKRVDFSYGPLHQLAGIARYASTTTSNPVATSQYAYDEHGRLIKIEHRSIGGFHEEFAYGYDGANRVDFFSSLFDGYSVEYEYDNRGQLTSADYTGGPMDESYGYDENGNRDTGGFTVDTNNRVLSDGTYSYEYDDEGNLAKRTHSSSYDSTIYSWDHRNRLVATIEYDGNGTASTGDDTITQITGNYYDPLNQWVRQIVDQDGNWGTTADFLQTVFVYQEGQVVLQFSDEGPGGDLSANDLTHRYLWGQLVDQLLADEVIGGDTLWTMSDRLSSVRDVVDNNGTLRKHTQYDGFGTITDEEYFDSSGNSVGAAHAEAVYQLFGFTGRPFDDFTGLQNNLNRWYDSSKGCWLSEDPIGFLGDDVNLYRFVSNQPTLYVDPTGLQLFEPRWRNTPSGPRPYTHPRYPNPYFPNPYFPNPYYPNPYTPNPNPYNRPGTPNPYGLPSPPGPYVRPLPSSGPPLPPIYYRPPNNPYNPTYPYYDPGG